MKMLLQEYEDQIQSEIDDLKKIHRYSPSLHGAMNAMIRCQWLIDGAHGEFQSEPAPADWESPTLCTPEEFELIKTCIKRLKNE